jgi:hypothetical protein
MTGPPEPDWDDAGFSEVAVEARAKAQSKWDEHVTKEYERRKRIRAGELEKQQKRMANAANIGNVIGLGTVTIVTAGFGVASPTFGAIYGGYETGVSTVEAFTGKSSGAHVFDLASGNISPGKQLSTLERALNTAAAITGWVGIRSGGGGGGGSGTPPSYGGGGPLVPTGGGGPLQVVERAAVPVARVVGIEGRRIGPLREMYYAATKPFWSVWQVIKEVRALREAARRRRGD